MVGRSSVQSSVLARTARSAASRTPRLRAGNEVKMAVLLRKTARRTPTSSRSGTSVGTWPKPIEAHQTSRSTPASAARTVAGSSRSPTRTTVSGGSQRRSLVGRTSTSASGRRATTTLPRKPVAADDERGHA